MANIICNQQVNDKVIQMSNGATSVFIETLCMSGANLATESYQKDLMIWFAQRDWTIIGMGCEGFDIQEIIWNNVIFEEQESFILVVIEQAMNETNWKLLDCTANEELLFKNIEEFKRDDSIFRSC